MIATITEHTTINTTEFTLLPDLAIKNKIKLATNATIVNITLPKKHTKNR